MLTRREAVVREFCEAWGDGSAESKPNVAKLMSKFAANAYWQLWVPGGPVIQGKAALEAEIHRQLSGVTHQRCEIKKLISSGDKVCTERLDSFRMNGVDATSHVAAIFEFNDAGEISAWREYFDMVNLARQLAMDPAVLERAQRA